MIPISKTWLAFGGSHSGIQVIAPPPVSGFPGRCPPAIGPPGHRPSFMGQPPPRSAAPHTHTHVLYYKSIILYANVCPISICHALVS